MRISIKEPWEKGIQWKMDLVKRDSVKSLDQWVEERNHSTHNRFKVRQPSLTILIHHLCICAIKTSWRGHLNWEVVQLNSEKRMYGVAPFIFCRWLAIFSEGDGGECLRLKVIITKYYKAFGQCINNAKSNLVFNKGVYKDSCKAIEEELQIQGVTDPGKYLGIPSIWGRSKNEALGYIKNRIRDKIQGWRTKP